MSVLSEDVSTFLMFAPEEEYLGAKVKHVLLSSSIQDGIIPLCAFCSIHGRRRAQFPVLNLGPRVF